MGEIPLFYKFCDSNKVDYSTTGGAFVLLDRTDAGDVPGAEAAYLWGGRPALAWRC